MVQCEMCGVETPTPKTVKIEGAELQVCASCAEFGTEVSTPSDGTTSTKYSTASSGSSADESGSASSSSRSSGSRSRRRRDMFDDMDEVVPDFDSRIRNGRESMGLTQAELADELNEKTSLIRKLERGEHLPSDTIRRKLERYLDIHLLEGGGSDDEGMDEWSGGETPSGMTLGDVVKRKD